MNMEKKQYAKMLGKKILESIVQFQYAKYLAVINFPFILARALNYKKNKNMINVGEANFIQYCDLFKKRL